MSSENGEENREQCCTPDFQEFVCRGVSILVMGSSYSIGSCDEAQLLGRTTNELASNWSARLVFDRIKTSSYWGLCVLVLAANIKQGAYGHLMAVLVPEVRGQCSCRMLEP